MAVPKRRRTIWNKGFLTGHSDGRMDAALRRPRADFLLGEEIGPDQWGRGYLQGYEEGYSQGVKELERQGA